MKTEAVRREREAHLSRHAQELVEQAGLPFRRIPVIKPAQEKDFRDLWAQHLPVHVTPLNIHGDWSPRRFMHVQGIGKLTVLVDDSRYSDPRQMRLEEFLQEFMRLGEGGYDYTMKLKVG